MKIIGSSGATTFLVAQLLRRYRPKVYIKESEVINNHSAVLRFSSDKIFKTLNIPCNKVKVEKSIFHEGVLYSESNIRLNNMYSQKVTGRIQPRSILNMKDDYRYIAPKDFVNILTYDLDIVFNSNVEEELFNDPEEIKVSYLSMKRSMELTGYENIPEFSFYPIYTLNVKISNPECNIYQTIYYPGLEKYYRATITKDTLIVEYIREPYETEREINVRTILDQFGIVNYSLGDIKFNTMKMGKMNPIPEEIRQDFIFNLTNKFNIYSVGRNATWKSIKLDEVFDDTLKIDKLITNGNYFRSKQLMNR